MRFFAPVIATVLISSGSVASHAQTSTQLQQQITAIVGAHHGKVALFAENLKTGETVGFEPDQVVQTASVIKLTILYEAMEQVREGKVHLDDKIALEKADQVPGSGILLFFDTPLTITLKDALTMMVIMSDNTATNLVIDHLGLGSINARIKRLGLKDTYLYKKVFQPAEGPMPTDQKVYGLGKTTPREMADVMRKIVTCDLAEPDLPSRPQDDQLCGVVLHMLTDQFYRDGIPRYIEGLDTTEGQSAIASKTGSLDAVRNDIAAISSKNGLLIISIFTYDNQDHSWTSDNEGEITAAKLAKAIVNTWSPAGLMAFPQSHVSQ
jgi:beta-lactamase class A